MAVRKRLGDLLLESGTIDANQLQAALGHQRKWGGRLGQALVDMKLATEAQIVEALSRMTGYAAVKLDALQPGPLLNSALNLLPREFAFRHNLLPYASDTSTVSVAMADPANVALVDEVGFRAGRRVKIALAGDREIALAIRRLYYPGEGQVESIALELDAGEAPEAAIADQFGGGTTDALEDFFSQPRQGKEPAARAAPIPAATGPQAGAATPASPGQLDLEDLAPAPAADREAGPEAAAAQAAPGGDPPERTGTLELPLDAEVREPEEEPRPAALSAGGLSQRDLAILDDIEHLARGEPGAPVVVKPAQLAAALARLLLRKKFVTEAEFLDELGRK
jgi:type IV pilus assembly protein PilB